MMIQKDSKSDTLFNLISGILLALVLLLVLYPLWFVIIASISEPNLVNSGKVWLYPKGITFEGYQRVFRNADIWIGYRNSILYTIGGTIINLVFTLLCAYPLSRRDFVGKQLFTVMFTFTMFFSGGLIPTYLLIQDLNMLDSIWSLLLPGAISFWNVIICRTYFSSSIPWELQEAAMIDGASNTRIFISLIIPLSAPIIAVIALYYGVGHWNAYFDAMIYISNKAIKPLQLFLREILIQQQMNSQMMMSSGDMESMAIQARIADIIKYAVMIVSTIPVMIVYPLLQKYFVKGVMVGAIKG